MNTYLEEFAICASCVLYTPHCDAIFVSCPLCAMQGHANYFPVIAGSFGDLKMHLSLHRYPKVCVMLFCMCMSSAVASNFATSPQVVDRENCTSEKYGGLDRRADHLRWKCDTTCSDEWAIEEKDGEGEGERHSDLSKHDETKKKRVTFTLTDSFSEPNPFPVDRDQWCSDTIFGALQRQGADSALAEKLGCRLITLYECADWHAVSICLRFYVYTDQSLVLTQ